MNAVPSSIRLQCKVRGVICDRRAVTLSEGNPKTPAQPRQFWNTSKPISSRTMFNLTRHSHHHAQGEVPYHDLKPFPDAPMVINRYLTTLIVP